MRTLTVAISDVECAKFGIKTNKFAFSELFDLISREILRQNFDECVSLAEKYGLSTMSMAEINDEVMAVRQRVQ
jgi:hypothetical protein